MDFKLEIAKVISQSLSNIELDEIISMIEIPPNPDMGDYAFLVFV